MLLSHAALAQFEPSDQAPTQDVNSALGALSILPPEYQNFVVKVSADNGTHGSAAMVHRSSRLSRESGRRAFQPHRRQWRDRSGKADFQRWRIVQDSKSDRHRATND